MNRGFTLVELMITLAIMAIIAAFAAPSFTRLIEDNRVTTQANDLLSSLSLARSEAVKRGVTVTVTPNAGGFAAGWCVHTGANCAAGTLRVHEGFTQVAMGGNDIANAIAFDSFGVRVNQAAADFDIEFTPPSCLSGDTRQRQLTVRRTGHAAITLQGCP
ncbi:GspH/FimT family pseudopilin [Denitromonas sp.]|uniref:GspH/FimT family pseudopilin n=1 Tax=Denitromonas sp. TaxID=2734609 RepID=UPI002AFE654D|nr:GspH/FimT family pseudopilin [Denitromonas sp.]